MPREVLSLASRYLGIGSTAHSDMLNAALMHELLCAKAPVDGNQGGKILHLIPSLSPLVCKGCWHTVGPLNMANVLPTSVCSSRLS